MTVVYVLRHPETIWNATKRYQGRLESPISPLGQLQARVAADTFEDVPVDAIYSSPLRRALYLAEQLQTVTESQILVDQRLTEMGQSAWEGLYLSEIRALYPSLYQRWYSRPDQVRFPDGESVDDVASRALSAFSVIFERHPDGSVAITTHSVVLQALTALALGLDFRYLHRLKIDNAKVSTFLGNRAPGTVLSLNADTPRRVSQVAEQVDERSNARRMAS